MKLDGEINIIDERKFNDKKINMPIMFLNGKTLRGYLAPYNSPSRYGSFLKFHFSSYVKFHIISSCPSSTLYNTWCCCINVCVVANKKVISDTEKEIMNHILRIFCVK